MARSYLNTEKKTLTIEKDYSEFQRAVNHVENVLEEFNENEICSLSLSRDSYGSWTVSFEVREGAGF